ncbi:TAXI family TRAP transporter solute-binding subunit [Plantactinospora sp. WMMB334]|uniref:TAXI family TRAP transporter solute-binding subunit n=1 Tax=Plantactinospora sp. WMMB334 TaxID=3404119 RepID=UPI003B949E99
MKKINQVYEDGVIPAATYGTPADVRTIVVPNVLWDLDANLVCVLTGVLSDRKAQLEQVNAAAREISLDTARKTAPVPLHRGAAQGPRRPGRCQVTYRPPPQRPSHLTTKIPGS